MEMSLRTASLYYNTLRYLKPCQIYGRIAHGAKAQAQHLLSPVFRSWYTHQARRSVRAFDPRRLSAWKQHIGQWLGDGEVPGFDAQAILHDRFSFLNRTVTFDGPVDWRAAAMPKLWRYHLHYFDYLVDLARAHGRSADPLYADKLKHLVLDWTAANPLGCGDGWEPYALSLRLVNWIRAYVQMAAAGSDALLRDAGFHQRFLTSLHTQAAFLEGNLEFHLLGNHLIKNAKALLYAGFFFEGAAAARWRQRGRDLLDAQLDEQILEDGGHFERSPMYHALVLEDLAESLALMKRFGYAPDRYHQWRERILRMARFLEIILHPDKQIPLLNDSTFGVAPDPLALVEKIHRLFGRVLHVGGASMRFTELSQTGYYVIQDQSGQNKMIMDCGLLGPDYLPGHAHSDTLSYELSFAGERVIVDTGVYEYRAGDLRDYCRRTAAHNTVTVDGLDQSEMWSSFRVARRARPTRARIQDKGDYVLFEGAHDGYLKKSGVLHTRRVFFVEPALWIVADLLEGQGTHLVEGFIHLHPDVSASLHAADDELSTVRCVSRSGRRFVISLLPPGCMDLKPAPYFPEFGKRAEAKVLRYWLHGALPARAVYMIAPENRHAIRLQWLDRRVLAVFINGERRLLSC